MEAPLPFVERLAQDRKALNVDKDVDVFGLPPCASMGEGGSTANEYALMAEVARYLSMELVNILHSDGRSTKER